MVPVTSPHLDSVLLRAPDGSVVGEYDLVLSEPLTEHFPWGKLVEGRGRVEGRWAPRVAAIFGARILSWSRASAAGAPAPEPALVVRVPETVGEKAARKRRRSIAAPIESETRFADVTEAEEAPPQEDGEG